MQNEFVDTHCHIQSVGLTDGERSTRELWAKDALLTADKVLTNATAAGVTRLICVGCDLADSELAIDFASQHDGVWASIGLHPHEAQHYANQPEKLEKFADLASQPYVVAIGECGLDYFYTHSPKKDQYATLRFQLALAQKHDLPLIFHVREAFDEFWPLFDEFKGLRGVLHSFTDSQANMQAAVERGLYIGVNGIATFAKQPEQLAMYKAIPEANLVLETDAPFLTPTPFRGTINEPKHISTIATFLADLKGMSLEELAKSTTQNAKELFTL